MCDTYEFSVASYESGLRLDAWLSEKIADLSRSRIQCLIKSGDVSSMGRSITAHSKVKTGMVVCVQIPPVKNVDIVPEDIPLDVIYEDGDIIVVNKPAGMVVHPAVGHYSGTFVNALLFHCKDIKGIGGEMRPGIVHRLDKDTSGVLIAAKNDKAMEKLLCQFKNREVKKEYLAVVHGVPDPLSGEISMAIGRSRHDRKKMSANPSFGREAVSVYTVEERYASTSLVRVRIETGRTHQIRVHMQHIGNPVAGDSQYGSVRLDKTLPERPVRQMLHAQYLSLRHPSEDKIVEFTAPLQEDMTHLLSILI